MCSRGVARVFQLMFLGKELVGKVGERATRLHHMLEGTKESIAIRGKFLNDSLFTEVALVMGVTGVKFLGQLGTVVRVGMSGGSDAGVARCCALIRRVSI
jgi:gamma-glutamyltranspeptidase